MKILYFDCATGISGDMTVAALLDLGVEKDSFLKELKKLNIDGYNVEIKRINKCGIMSTSFNVILDEVHDDHHHHDHHHHDHRTLKDIVKIIDESSLSENVKNISKNIFYRIGKAEGTVHGKPAEDVHFHEVGAIDSIVDIVGASICIDLLGIDKFYSSVLNEGHGFTFCQHGKIPIPVPAVVEILADAKAAFRQIDVPKELITPTGAGIITELCKSFGFMPEMKITAVGNGAGQRDLDIPNILRVYMGEASENITNEKITVIETNIDDTTPEVLGYTMEKLFLNGARDVFFTNIYMKKNRPAVKLTVLCDKETKAAMEKIIFSETTAIGVRVREEARTVLQRKECLVNTPYGDVKGKAVTLDGIEIITIEYEEAKKIAVEKNIPIKNILKCCTKKLDL